MILKNLLLAQDDGCSFVEMVPLLQGEFEQVSSMIEKTASLDDALDTSLFKLHLSFKEYLSVLKLYLEEFQVPCKYSIDMRRTCEVITRARVMEAEKKIAKSKTALQACPNREAVKRRMERVKEMKEKMSLLSNDMKRSNERLSLFRALDSRLLQQLSQATGELSEKQWAAEQLGGFYLDDSSIA